MNAALKLAAILSLLTVSVCAVFTTRAVLQLAADTSKTEAAIANTVATLPAKLDAVNSTVNRQLSTFNGNIGTITAQTNVLSQDLHNTFAEIAVGVGDADDALKESTYVLHSTHAVLADPDIPALIRDARLTVALTGATMGHIRTTANVIAEAAPSVASSIKTATDASSAIAVDVHKVADDFVKPRPLWKRILGTVGDAAGVARLFK